MFSKSPYHAKILSLHVSLIVRVLIIRIIIVVYTLYTAFTKGRIQSKTRIIVYIIIVHHMTQ